MGVFVDHATNSMHRLSRLDPQHLHWLNNFQWLLFSLQYNRSFQKNDNREDPGELRCTYKCAASHKRKAEANQHLTKKVYTSNS
jgi:hypothetical protein